MKRIAYTRWMLLPFALMLLAGCGLFGSNDDPGNDDPGPIQSIRIDGRNVVYARAGSGDVPVIFEAGLGDGLESWDPIFEDVAEFSTAFAYSRPGYGDSDCCRTTDLFTSSQMAKDRLARLRAISPSSAWTPSKDTSM